MSGKRMITVNVVAKIVVTNLYAFVWAVFRQRIGPKDLKDLHDKIIKDLTETDNFQKTIETYFKIIKEEK
jgi:hypothetical protein